MAEPRYYVIQHRDGDTTVHVLTKDELLERLNDPEYYGPDAHALPHVPHADPAYWGDGLLIILKGTVVTPRPVGRVTKFDID